MELCGSSDHSVQNSSQQPPVVQDLTKATCDRVYFDSLFEPKEYEVASYIVSVVGGWGDVLLSSFIHTSVKYRLS